MIKRKRFPGLEHLLKEGFVVHLKLGNNYLVCAELCTGRLSRDSLHYTRLRMIKKAGCQSYKFALDLLESCDKRKPLPVFADTLTTEDLNYNGLIDPLIWEGVDIILNSVGKKIRLQINSKNAPLYVQRLRFPLCVSLNNFEQNEKVRNFYRFHGYSIG